MNTSSISKLSVAGLGLLFSALLSTTAVAGPGPQFWAQQTAAAKARSEAAKSTTAPAAVQLCADAHVVAVTAMQPMMANGKGPLVERKVGTKTVCHICPVKGVSVKTAQANGKGPITVTETSQTGVEHNCANCTGTPVKS
jgi:hypothetical protein